MTTPPEDRGTSVERILLDLVDAVGDIAHRCHEALGTAESGRIQVLCNEHGQTLAARIRAHGAPDA